MRVAPLAAFHVGCKLQVFPTSIFGIIEGHKLVSIHHTLLNRGIIYARLVVEFLRAHLFIQLLSHGHTVAVRCLKLFRLHHLHLAHHDIPILLRE